MKFDPNQNGCPYNTDTTIRTAEEALRYQDPDDGNRSCSDPDFRPPHDPGDGCCVPGSCHFGDPFPPIDDLYKHLCDVYHKKNHDYGNSFEDGLDEDGLIFAKMHLMEKYNRFKKLISEPNLVHGEGIRDSLLDMANYAIMTVYWMDKHPNQTLK